MCLSILDSCREERVPGGSRSQERRGRRQSLAGGWASSRWCWRQIDRTVDFFAQHLANELAQFCPGFIGLEVKNAVCP